MPTGLADFGYANARIRAMKSYLLGKSFFEKILAMDNINSILNELLNTPYKREVNEIIESELSIAEIDLALDKNLSRTYLKISTFLDGEPKELLNIILGKWDIQNIKTLLRGKHFAFSTEKIGNSLVPAAQLDQIVLKELLKSVDVKGIVDGLATLNIHYSRPLTSKLSEYFNSRDLSVLELELDKYFYSNALRKTKKGSVNAKLVRDIIIAEIDVKNIITLLRIQDSELEEEEIKDLFIIGGKEIDLATFISLSKLKDVEAMVENLKNTSYGKMLGSAILKFMETGLISTLERVLEEGLVHLTVVKIFKGDQLTIGIIIGYIWAKWNEVVNLRIILRGKFMGMTTDLIKNSLILVNF